ncbi:MAG: GNAT family N-acetyltransferase [Candidatus Eremiobacteraeota bacterium]|nr:GNAT family N-acetyltransferase [Candidatus Eremiobacteraeota bacterium]
MTVPVIETPRLTLRAHTLDDFSPSLAMWADPIVTRYIGGVPSSAEAVWARLIRYAGHWALLGYGYWVVQEKGSQEFLGELGFADYHRDISPPIDAPELGWALIPRVHGRGYATEAVAAVLQWGDRHFQGSPTVCLIHPDNAPSVRVAEKNGYREWTRTQYKGEPAILFERFSETSQNSP